jgi:SAM-dependent methyltransferase
VSGAREIGRTYDAMHAHRLAVATPGEAERIGRFVRMVPDDTRTVLEVGSGDGRVARRMAALGVRVVGLDVAERTLARAGVPGVLGLASKLPFRDRSFDLVAASEVLEHIPDEDLPRAAAECARVARKYVLASVPYMEDLREARANCRDCGAVFHVWDHRRGFDGESLTRLWPGWRLVREITVGLLARTPGFVPLGPIQSWGYLFRERVEGLVCPRCGSGRLLGRRPGVVDRILRTFVWVAKVCLGRRRPQWIIALFERPTDPDARSEGEA